MDIKILEDLLQVTIERRNLWNRHYQIIQEDYGKSWSSQEWKSGAAAPGSGFSVDGRVTVLKQWDIHRSLCLVFTPFRTVNMELKLESGLWDKIILLGQNILWNEQICGRFF